MARNCNIYVTNITQFELAAAIEIRRQRHKRLFDRFVSSAIRTAKVLSSHFSRDKLSRVHQDSALAICAAHNLIAAISSNLHGRDGAASETGPPCMPSETAPGIRGFAQFTQRVQDDPELQRRLRHVDDREAFFAACVSLGAEYGYDFSVADVRAVLQEGQLAWLTHWLPVT